MPREMDLSGQWEIHPVNRFDGQYDSLVNWREARVPGHWQEIPEFERYAGKMVYRKRFKFMPDPTKRMFLRLNGAFYWTTAYLNGCRLGSNEGYFFPVEHEISGLLRKDNEAVIEVDCPNEEDKSYKRQLTGVFHHWDCIDPRTNPGGIWLPVEIVSTGPARLADPLFTTAYIDGKSSYARIIGRATIDLEAEANLTVRISFTPLTFEGETQVFERKIFKSRGSSAYHYNLDLKEPTLWWTHDHGKPDLYTLRVEVTVDGEDSPSDAWETSFGVRTFEMRDYIAYLNGRRMYIRGNNYPPGDARIARVTPERVAEDLELAKKCNLNLLRVHAHVDHPAFYRACDEKGMLLWQDFPMQWYYRPEVEDQAARQVERMIFLLGSRPSIGVWCMHNEPFRLFDVRKPFGPISIGRAAASLLFWNRNRDKMDKDLARKARFLDPHRFTTRCSGARGLFRETGDAHYYYGWYMGPLHWFHRVYKKHPENLKFITEFGSQSFPNLENAIRFMPARIEDVDVKKLEARHHFQRLFMYMFPRPKLNMKRFASLSEYIQATQDYQSELNRYHIDRIRRLKYKPGGGLVPFLLLDSNPAVQWSVIDYWRTPKSSYYAMKKCMSPVYAFTIFDKPSYSRGSIVSIPVYAVNDGWEEAPVEVRLMVKSPVGDDVIDRTWSETLPADCEALALGNPELKLKWSGVYDVRVVMGDSRGVFENAYKLKVR